jgi:hypothetical protein
LHDYNGNFVADIENQVTSEDVGKITIDVTRPIRRNFSFKLSKVDPTFTWGDDVQDLIWIDKYVKLHLGLMLPSGKIEYVPQGVFIVSEPSDSHTLQSKKRLSVNGQDKMALYTGNRGKFPHQVTLSKGINVATAIKTIMTTSGSETMFNFDDVSTVLPYDITYEVNKTIYEAIKQLADLAICDIYYDVYGYLRLKKIDLDEFAQYPPVWSFKYGDPSEKFYAGNERTLDESDMANHIVVVGGSSQTSTVSFEIIVDEANPFTIISTYGGSSFDGTLTTMAISDDGLTLSQYGTDFSQFLQVQSDWNTGTLTNISATTDNYLALPTETSISLRGTNTATTGITDSYYYNDIWSDGVGISSGDKLVYDVYIENSPEYKSGIDGYVPTVGALKSTTIKDQNGVSIHPKTDLTGKADNKWYHREFDLTSLAGKSLTSMQVAFEGDAEGNYSSYFKNIFIKDSSGNIKATILDGNGGTLKMTAITPSSNGSSTASYSEIGLTTMSLASQLSGNRISPAYDLSSVNLYGSSLVKWDNIQYANSTITMEYQISTNGGTTWGAWTALVNGVGLSALTQGTDLSNYKIQFRQTLTTTDITAIPKIGNMSIDINSEYKPSGSFVSSIFNLTDLQTSATGTTDIEIIGTVPFNTTMTNQYKISLDKGSTWTNWITVSNGSTISSITSNVTDLSQVQLQYQITMGTTDPSRTPTLNSISFKADSNLWNGNPYSIQKIGRLLYQHNNGSPDPAIATMIDARNRAKYELQRRLGFVEQATLSSAPIPLFEGYEFINIEDDTNGVTGNYRIKSISLPIVPSLMTIQCLKYKNMINSWNF